MLPELDDTAQVATTATLPGSPPTAPGAGIPAGSQLGHYRIEKQLGAGGMGEVYLATDLALDRPVAVKVLPAQVARDPARRDRLIREARSQARVLHPNVGHIYFIGEDAGRLYFAMEYVGGQTLGERVAKAPVPADEALALIRAAALGLREAQRSGITHRDVKPSNLMLDGHGIVKVLDFGLASSAPVEPAASDRAPVQQTTLAGTPLYMAPEQARGEPIDFRADIYALGATLYHLVSGRPPFTAESAHELQSLHSSAKRPIVPRDAKTKANQPRATLAAVDALCARMMAPAAGDRFASYDELVLAIENVSRLHTRPAGFWVRLIAAGLDFLIVGLAVVLLALVISWVVHRQSASVDVYSFAGIALYEVLATRRFGKTIGKALFEVEIVELATGARPGWRASAIRAGVLFALPVASSLVAFVAEMAGYEHGIVDAIVALSLPLLVVALAISALAAQGKRALWDRAAGTIVRYRR